MNTAGCFAPCSNLLCAHYGCQKQVANGTYSTYVPPPRGCICPPGANKECENQYCPRKALPVSAHIEVKK